MRKVVRVYQEWISMEDKPVFMKEPDEGHYPIATGGSLDSGSQHGDKEDEVRNKFWKPLQYSSRRAPTQQDLFVSAAVESLSANAIQCSS